MNYCPKSRFKTEKDALFFIRKMEQTAKNRERLPIFTYLCPRCHSWHLTKLEQFGSLGEEKYQKKIANLKEVIKKQNEMKTELFALRFRVTQLQDKLIELLSK